MALSPTEAERRYRDELISHPGIASLSPKDDKNLLVIGVLHEADDNDVINHVQSTLPPEADFELKLRQTSGFSFSTDGPQTEHDPVQPGLSTAPKGEAWSGTLGFVMTDGDDIYICSNNHVWPNSGAEVVHPSLPDAGWNEDNQTVIGEHAGNVGEQDLAWAKVKDDIPLSSMLHRYTFPQGGPVRPEEGDPITKTGRTTGKDSGEVTDRRTTIHIRDGPTYSDCIYSEDISDSGDSGSPVLRNSDHRPVGMVFAGSDRGTAILPAVQMPDLTGMSFVTGAYGRNLPCAREGRPRSQYVYTGSQTQFYDEWVAGNLTDAQFAYFTSPGEGLASLEVAGSAPELPADVQQAINLCGENELEIIDRR